MALTKKAVRDDKYWQAALVLLLVTSVSLVSPSNVLSQMKVFPSFLRLNKIPPLCTYHIFFILFSVGGRLACFRILVTVNSAAINTGVQTSL